MTMRAEIKRLHSPDVALLTTYVPEDAGDFGFLLQIMAGPVGTDGEESFDVVVCTARWIGHHLGSEGVLVGRHYLVVDSYDYRSLEGFLRRYVDQCSGHTWEEVAIRLGRLGKWEFEDYRP
jgi:hypothetical protein